MEHKGIPKAPHLFRWWLRAFARNVFGLLTAQHVPTTAHIRIYRLTEPCEFCADFFDV